jgi:flagellar motor switch protein FliG
MSRDPLLLDDDFGDASMIGAFPAPSVPLTAFNLSGPRKAAVLCIALGDDVAAEVLKHLNDDEVQMVFKELAAMQQVSPEISDTVLGEFHQLCVAEAYIASAGLDFAKRLLIKSLGPEYAKRMLDKVTHSLEASVGFEALKKVNPQQLAKFLQKEHPQTIALVLAHLDASTAADTLGFMPEAGRSDVIMRMAHLQAISQDVIRRVLLVLDQKLKAAGDYSHQVGGIRTAAELCNRLDRDASRKALEEVEMVNPELALEIRNLMVTFDDLLLLDDFGIREILKLVDKKVLALSLKGAVPEIQNRFFSNMSAKAVEMMKEEIEYMGQIRMKDVSAAQREVVNVLRELDEQGVISLSGEEGYVA